MKIIFIPLLILLILVSNCKTKIDDNIKGIRTPIIYQSAYKGNFSQIKKIISNILKKKGFSEIDTNFFVKDELSIKITQGMDKTIYIYIGKIKNYNYVPIDQTEKNKLLKIVNLIRDKITNEKTVVKKNSISSKKRIRKKNMLFENFKIEKFDNFSVFSCDVINVSRHLYINVAFSINFFNEYGTLVETKQLFIRYLGSYQREHKKIMLNINQKITNFEITSVVINLIK